MLTRRQIDVQRENLASMCRISVKSLLDYACLYTHVDDDSEEFINFCSVFEQMVVHRLRPYQRKVWLRGSGPPRHFWEVLVENHNSRRGSLFQTCIPNIEAIETLKSPKAKLRAFIRVALMEKRLSDYIYWLLENPRLIRESYMEGALLASEEASVLCGDLIGLNAIDFNFCLKGNENELLGPLEISYAPFLKYKQTSASRSSDEIEMLRLSGEPSGEVVQTLTEGNLNDLLRLQSLEKDFRGIKEQKDYLEELVRLRDRQLAEANLRLENMRIAQHGREQDVEKEYKLMNVCMLELQEELSKLRQQNNSLKLEVAGLRQYKERLEMKEVPLMDMAGPENMQMEHLPERLTAPPPPSMMLQPYSKKEASPVPSDRRSILSSASDHLHLREDSQSMVPLTGSLSDVNAAIVEATTKPIVTSADSSSRVPAPIEEDVPVAEERTDGNSAVDPNLSQIVMEESKEVLQAKSSIPESNMEGPSQESNVGTDGNTDPSVQNQTGRTGEEETVSPGLNESYVLTGESDAEEKDKSTTVPLVCVTEAQEEDSPTDSPVSIGDPSSAPSPEFGDGDGQVMVLSDGAGSSDKEEDVSNSDPEVLERGNTSSDGSDAAWEMLSDSEQKSEAEQ
ncbi:RUN domain-containing protein 3A [Aplysia californica]|uniref:RUN domain-containing protein 3A n=1 Tax=Aplysia californica TaxID=6500 RepID=A0ABM0JVN6_APLCA|nr:RUN domain-containing protein 3A [Aplysia californica]